MIKEKGKKMTEKGKIFSVIMLCMLLFGDSSQGDVNIFGWADGGFMTNSNVYSDSRQFGDSGYCFNTGIGLRTKLARYTPFKINYNLDINGYFTYNLENEIFHSVKASLGHLVLDSIEVELSGYIDYSNLLNSQLYNYQKIGALPTINWYLLDHTAISGTFIYDDMKYSGYNLDNQGIGYSAKLEQELSLYTSIKGIYSYKKADYSEKYLYSNISYAVPSYQSELRNDKETKIEIILSHDFSLDAGLNLIYQNIVFDSSDNFVDWGASQSETLNSVIGDEKILPDYRSYSGSSGGVKLKITLEDSTFNILAFYSLKYYRSRPAKDSNDLFLQPEEKRKDQNTVLSIFWTKQLQEWINLKLGTSYENNNSNDALFKYTKLDITACLSTGF